MIILNMCIQTKDDGSGVINVGVTDMKDANEDEKRVCDSFMRLINDIIEKLEERKKWRGVN